MTAVDCEQRLVQRVASGDECAACHSGGQHAEGFRARRVGRWSGALSLLDQLLEELLAVHRKPEWKGRKEEKKEGMGCKWKKQTAEDQPISDGVITAAMTDARCSDGPQQGGSEERYRGTEGMNMKDCVIL